MKPLFITKCKNKFPTPPTMHHQYSDCCRLVLLATDCSGVLSGLHLPDWQYPMYSIHRPTDYIIHRPTDYIIHRPTDYIIHRPTDYIIHRPTDYIIHRPIDYIWHSPGWERGSSTHMRSVALKLFLLNQLFLCLSFVLQKKMQIECMGTERALLGFVLAKIHKLDPDLIVVSWLWPH